MAIFKLNTTKYILKIAKKKDEKVLEFDQTKKTIFIPFMIIYSANHSGVYRAIPEKASGSA